MTTNALSVVQRWHTALNGGEIDAMLALVHPQVEIGGPRGSTRGIVVMREWFGRANVRLLPQRWFVANNQVVVEEMGEWLAPETGATNSRQVIATAFDVDTDGLITRVVRHDALAAALEDRCMMLDDEVQVG